MIFFKDIITKNQYTPYFLIISTLTLFILPCLMIDGLFMDGLIYATLSKNLSNNIGTSWCTHFSNTSYQRFYEHPPLAIIIQSYFYNLFGNIKSIPKIYSLVTFLIVGIFICKIWKLYISNRQWMPILIWLSIPIVRWAIWSNLLENTMSIFVISSIYFYLKFKLKEKIYLLTLSGILLCFAFLTKGFVSLYPLVLPLLYNLIYRKNNFKKILKETIIMFFSFLIPIVFLIYNFDYVKIFFEYYIKNQVLNSLNNIRTVDSRFYIVYSILFEMVTILTIVFILYLLRSKVKNKHNFNHDAFFFFFLALSGSIPVIISFKQSDFYIISVYPLFSIAIGMFIHNKINIPNINFTQHVIIKIVATIILITSFYLSINTSTRKKYFFLVNDVNNYNSLNKFYIPTRVRWGVDENDLVKNESVLKICNKIRPNSTIYCKKEIWNDISLQGYFAFYNNITLNYNLNSKSKNILIFDKKNKCYSIIKR